MYCLNVLFVRQVIRTVKHSYLLNELVIWSWNKCVWQCLPLNQKYLLLIERNWVLSGVDSHPNMMCAKITEQPTILYCGEQKIIFHKLSVT